MDASLRRVLEAAADQETTADSAVKRPNNESLAKQTGLDAVVVAASLATLQNAGLLDGARTMGSPAPHLMQIHLTPAGVRVLELLQEMPP